MSNGNTTKKQHYIPQVYLRGFSPEYSRKSGKQSKSKYTIYRYNTNNSEQCFTSIPIKTICHIDNLYEVTGHNGETVFINYLEHFFSNVETLFGSYRDRLERKAFIKDNYRTLCFLTNEEKIFWVIFASIQILRLPEILKIAETVSKELSDKITEKQSKNLARLFCLPFFKELENHDKSNDILKNILTPMCNMSFGIGVDRERKIITADKPVYILSKSFSCDEYDKVIFPISSELCLFLFGNEYKKLYPKNFLFPIDDEIRKEIFKSISYSSFKWLFSNHLLDKKEQGYIEEILKEKQKVI